MHDSIVRFLQTSCILLSEKDPLCCYFTLKTESLKISFMFHKLSYHVCYCGQYKGSSSKIMRSVFSEEHFNTFHPPSLFKLTITHRHPIKCIFVSTHTFPSVFCWLGEETVAEHWSQRMLGSCHGLKTWKIQ